MISKDEEREAARPAPRKKIDPAVKVEVKLPVRLQWNGSGASEADTFSFVVELDGSNIELVHAHPTTKPRGVHRISIPRHGLTSALAVLESLRG